MRTTGRRLAAAGLVVATSVPVAAAPAEPPPGTVMLGPESALPLDYELGKELVVRDWVLCTTQPFAEKIARAWVDGPNAALQAYGELVGAKSCGQFPELRVILRERVYQSAPDVDHDVRVFAASVNIGDGWPAAFVVDGGLPAE